MEQNRKYFDMKINNMKLFKGGNFLFSFSPLPFLFHGCTDAGAVIHTHSKAAVMATLLYPGREFCITHQEMIKGVGRGSGKPNLRYHDELVVSHHREHARGERFEGMEVFSRSCVLQS